MCVFVSMSVDASTRVPYSERLRSSWRKWEHPQKLKIITVIVLIINSWSFVFWIIFVFDMPNKMFVVFFFAFCNLVLKNGAFLKKKIIYSWIVNFVSPCRSSALYKPTFAFFVSILLNKHFEIHSDSSDNYITDECSWIFKCLVLLDDRSSDGRYM